MIIVPAPKFGQGVGPSAERFAFTKMPRSIQSMVKQINDLASLNMSDAAMRNRSGFLVYALRLNILKKLGVLTQKKTMLYPLMGADLLPAKFSRVIGVDRDMTDVSSKKARDEFVSEIKWNMKLDLEDMSVRPGTTTVKYDLMRGPEKLISVLRENKIKKIDVLLLKGVPHFMMIGDGGSGREMGYYDARMLELIIMLNKEFIPVGGHIVFIEVDKDTREIEEDLMRNLGYEDYLSKTLTPEQRSIVEGGYSWNEDFRVQIDENVPRLYMLSGSMRVFQKVR